MPSGLLRRLAAVLVLLSMISCSIKEDRSGCPCILTVDLSGAKAKIPPGMLPMRISVFSGETWVAETFTDSDAWSAPVPRGRLAVRVSAIADASQPSALPSAKGTIEEGLRIPEGEECPKVYWSREEIDADGDEAAITPRVRKDYCKLTVSFAGSPPGTMPYNLLFVGNIAGYDRLLSPLEGPFRYLQSQIQQTGTSPPPSVNLPRQKDASLRMDIVSDGAVLRSFALGHYIESAGYDWTSFDLEDLNLEINFSATTITLSTASWTVVSYFEIMI